MASTGRKIITGIEFGTDKICVVHGMTDKSGSIDVLSFASRPSKNSVVKGMIVDKNSALNILKEALEESEKSLDADFDRSEQKVFYLVNGSHVCSRQGEGTVLIYDADGKVTHSHVEEAVGKAKNLVVSPDLTNIQVYDSYFLLDENKRFEDPVGQLAEKLTAMIHIVFAEKKRLETVQLILRELGFESGYPLFAPLADAYCAMTSDERRHGALLFDYGAGVCSYTLLFHEGILLSGSIPTGVNNVANDLSIALDLPYDYCQKFLRESMLETLRAQGKSMVEYLPPGSAANKVRRIPLDSFEKVMDLRQRETFTLMRGELERAKLMQVIRTGVVMTGGGSLIASAPKLMMDVMSLPVRCAGPVNVAGALSSFRSPMPCYTSILGLLKHAAAIDIDTSTGSGGVREAVENVADHLLHGLHALGEAFKL